VPTNPTWERLKSLGSELWFDSGDIEEVEKLWTREFTALTTNNTLLNKEVQKGIYDDFLARAVGLLAEYPQLSDEERKLELAFIVNARHALRLVESFDAFVSVEEHTDLSNDVEASVNYARRYFAICPQRFYVKIPFSAAGLIATRTLSDEGIPVNHTLGFSARQNYLIARAARPAFLNVFMGRLNAFIANNKLGDGKYVGEKATLASQRTVEQLRETMKIPTRQIGASFRSGEQVRDLAGIDVMTIPTKVAKEFLDLSLAPEALTSKRGGDYEVTLEPGVHAETIRLDTLWDVPDKLATCVDRLESEDWTSMSAEWLTDFMDKVGCGDVLFRWTPTQMKVSAREGKIPEYGAWRSLLAEKKIGLDTLMTLAGWNSFNADQKAMDERIAGVVTAAR
jgi:transaldolase